MNQENCLGIDYGTVKTGLALNVGSIAMPFKIIRTKGAIAEISGIIKEKNIGVVVVGIANHMNGAISKQAILTNKFILELKKSIGKNIKIIEVDESLTTFEAISSFESHGIKKENIGKIDDVAASLILQSYLDEIAFI